MVAGTVYGPAIAWSWRGDSWLYPYFAHPGFSRASLHEFIDLVDEVVENSEEQCILDAYESDPDGDDIQDIPVLELLRLFRLQNPTAR